MTRISQGVVRKYLNDLKEVKEQLDIYGTNYQEFKLKNVIEYLEKVENVLNEYDVYFSKKVKIQEGDKEND